MLLENLRTLTTCFKILSKRNSLNRDKKVRFQGFKPYFHINVKKNSLNNLKVLGTYKPFFSFNNNKKKLTEKFTVERMRCNLNIKLFIIKRKLFARWELDLWQVLLIEKKGGFFFNSVYKKANNILRSFWLADKTLTYKKGVKLMNI